MPLDVQVLEEADHERLERLVVASPHGSVFATPSWARFMSVQHECVGVFKGLELVGGGVVPLSDGRVARHVEFTPWVGLVGRREDESECLEIARGVAESLLARYPETTLTLPPEWTDLRAFTWLGMRAHVRYTYRGFGGDKYEKRLKFAPCFIHRDVVHEDGAWTVRKYATGNSVVTTVEDWRTSYYWKANKGGTFHAELVNTMIQKAESEGRDFDMVGCNSPARGLFKRAFGGRLTPYYAVTTSDARDLREPDARHPNLRKMSAGTETAYTAGMQAV